MVRALSNAHLPDVHSCSAFGQMRRLTKCALQYNLLLKALLVLLTTLLSQNKRLRPFDIYIYEGHSINKLQNDIIVKFSKYENLVQNMKIWIYTFCRKFNWEHILEFL